MRSSSFFAALGFIVVSSLTSACVAPDDAPDADEETTSDELKRSEFAGYQTMTASGFRVLVNDAVVAHPAESAAVQAAVRTQLAEIERLFGPERLVRLKSGVRIWIEWEQRDSARRPRGPAEFHPYRDWLAANGYLVAKENGLEINDTRMFLAAANGQQPFAMMHELAHAYDFLVLGAEQGAIQQAYAAALASGRYASVWRMGDNSRPQRAYALADRREYFSELTEAYLGMNDFFPHVREQLQETDPQGYALMVRVWGPPAARTNTASRACGTGLRSPSKDSVASAVVLTNRGSRPLDISWIAPNGARTAPWRLAPGATVAQGTYEGHVFTATDDTGRCVTFTAQSRPRAVLLGR